MLPWTLAKPGVLFMAIRWRLLAAATLYGEI
jgi:hypothetical protein